MHYLISACGDTSPVGAYTFPLACPPRLPALANLLQPCLHCWVADLRVQAIATESSLPHLLVDFQAYWNWLVESENLTSWRSF